MKHPSPKRAALLGAVLLGALPLWTLPLMAVGAEGFLGYLWLSQAYYGGARRVFGGGLFPYQEFGVVPRGAAGLIAAATLYGLLGAAVGWGIAAVMERRSQREE